MTRQRDITHKTGSPFKQGFSRLLTLYAFAFAFRRSAASWRELTFRGIGVRPRLAKPESPDGAPAGGPDASSGDAPARTLLGSEWAASGAELPTDHSSSLPG